VAWGANNYGQTSVPEGLTGVVAVAAGQLSTVALKEDGTVMAWGSTGQVPTDLTNAVASSEGWQYTLALVGYHTRPSIVSEPADQTVYSETNALWRSWRVAAHRCITSGGRTG